MWGHVALLVMCLTADPGVASSIPVWSHTFVEIDREVISTAILLPSTDSSMVVVSYAPVICIHATAPPPPPAPPTGIVVE